LNGYRDWAYVVPVAKRIVLEGPAADAVERLAQSGRMSIADLITSALRREAAAQEDNATGESVKSASAVKSPDAKAPAGPADEDEDQVEPTYKAFLRLVTSAEIPEGPSAGPEAGPLRRDNP
jgi:hypothetical protein